MLAVGRGGMDESFKLTRQEIADTYDAGRDAVIALVEGLIERIAALEQDSHDSGKPPSRDSFERKQLKRRSTRRERTDKRRPGGQPEHPGTTLRQVEQPDRVTIHAVERCACGRSLVDEPVTDWERRQVFEVPPMQVAVRLPLRSALPPLRSVPPALMAGGATLSEPGSQRASAYSPLLLPSG